MLKKVSKWALLCNLFFLFPLQSFDSLYLTFAGDPAHSMAIHWLEEGLKDEKVLYRKLKEEAWQSASYREEKWGKDLLKRSLLTNLEADTDYEFCLEEDSTVHRFRTLPASLESKLQIAIGGDAYQKADPLEEMNKVVALMAPDFVILGGDIAYANQGDPIKRWKEFLRIWYKTMRTQEGRIIPLVAAVGNHEILPKSKGGGGLFLQLFPYLENGSYGTVDLVGCAFFLLLDTGHMHPIEGVQTDWVERVLKEKKEYPYKFAIYHIAAYPSIYKYKGETPSLIRTNWCPLFEKNGVKAAFENHNHAFKRTYPIRAEKIDPSGVVYIGDGAWSVPPRSKKDRRWYLEKRESCNCFSLLTLTKEYSEVQTFDIKGRLIDQWNTETNRLGEKKGG
ncbi:MAG: metallophosphoesterase family protein [Chlamydiota bacterium]